MIEQPDTFYPETVEDLLLKYKQPVSKAWVMQFHDLPAGMAAYNASKIFEIDNVTYTIVRVEGEKGDEEFTSELACYSCCEDVVDCHPADISNIDELLKGKIAQDPSYAYVNGKHVVTWVEVRLNDSNDAAQGSSWKSVVAIGDSINELSILTETGDETKGLRFIELIDGRIGFTTRTSVNAEYKMCFGIADTWEDITQQVLVNATEVKGLEGLTVVSNSQLERRWVGPNDMTLLADGSISLLMHLGRFEEDQELGEVKVYDAGHCILEAGKVSEPAVARYAKVIGRAKDCGIRNEELRPKRDEHTYVLYPSTVIISEKSGENALLVTALRDAGMVVQNIEDPLKEWRSDHPDLANCPFYV